MACCSACLGDPIAILLAERKREPARVGGLLPTVTWPGDVDREKERIDPLFVATDLAVAQCQGLSEAERQGWATFYRSWREFRGRETGLFGSANQWELAQRFALDLAGWQKTLATKCTLAGPIARPTVDPDAPAADLSALKWVAGAVIVVAGVYALKTVWP